MILEVDSDAVVDEDDVDGDDDDDNDDGDDKPAPTARSNSPVLAIPSLPLVPDITDANMASTSDVQYKPASSDVAESSKSALDRQPAPPVPRRREGWFVAYHAVLPGVYFGV
jgi:hypothetical protein